MRIVTQLLVLLPLLWVEGVWAVNCASTNYELTDQSEVDALGASGCDAVIGTLFIGGQVWNVDALVSIRSVGTLQIKDTTQLVALDGLLNLETVEAIYLDSNSALANVDFLSGITSVGRIDIRHNPALGSFDQLSHLTRIPVIALWDNEVLETIDLSNLESADEIYLSEIPVFDLSSLSGLTHLSERISISNLDEITNVDFISGVSGILDVIDISENDKLLNVDGFSGITELRKGLNGYLRLEGNGLLNNLNGFVNIREVDMLAVARHPSLSDCTALAPLLGWPDGLSPDKSLDYLYVRDNSSGCNSVEEILASVSGPTQPVITEATTSSNSISLAFTSSTTTDTLFPITGYSASCDGSDFDVSGSPATDLLDNTPVQETLTVSGYDPTVLSSVEVDIDITHSDPTDLYITLTSPEGTELILWNRGSAGGEDLVGTFPATLTAVDSLNSVTSQTMDGDWLLSIEDIDVGPVVREGVLNSWGIRITEEVAASGASSPIEVTGITQGREYQCKVAPVTRLGKVPESEPFIVNPSAATVFIRLLDSVLKTTQSTDSESAMDSGRLEQPQARVGQDDEPNAIPTLPMLGLFILSGLIGLFGIRRFALQ